MGRDGGTPGAGLRHAAPSVERISVGYRVGWSGVEHAEDMGASFGAVSGCIGRRASPPHDLRHTAASLAVRAGANVKAVQRMLGHAKASR